MNYLIYHLNDGADWQARAVLACLGTRGVPENVDLNVARYQNGREQGYIFTARVKHTERQRNYAVYEHRNSDGLCVVVNDTHTFGEPDSALIYEGMKDKWDTTKDFSCGQILECAEWIQDDISEWAQQKN